MVLNVEFGKASLSIFKVKFPFTTTFIQFRDFRGKNA